MNRPSFRTLTAVASALVLAFLLTGVAEAQRRQQGTGRPTVGIDVSLKAGSDGYVVRGQGECTHASQASIYGVSAEMWSVRHQEQGRSLQLTVWKPTDGSATMLSLSLNGKTSANVSTVRGGSTSGSGTVSLEQAGKGGTFTVNAKTATGGAVTGTVKCDGFTPAIAEGGN